MFTPRSSCMCMCSMRGFIRVMKGIMQSGGYVLRSIIFVSFYCRCIMSLFFSHHAQGSILDHTASELCFAYMFQLIQAVELYCFTQSTMIQEHLYPLVPVSVWISFTRSLDGDNNRPHHTTVLHSGM